MPRFIIFLCLNIIMLSTLTGCFDAHEVSEFSYVYSIGMEKGVTDQLRMTVQVPSMKSGAGGGNESGGGAEVQQQGDIVTITIDCPSFYSGVDMINTFMSRELNYMHTKFMVFSENLAREGIDTYITGFIRGRQVRRQENIIVCEGSASNFLKENQTKVSSSLSKKQQNIMGQSKNTGFFSDVVYGNMLNDSKTPYSQPIAILAAVNDMSKFVEGEGDGDHMFKTSGDYYAGELNRNGGSKVEFLGTAVFDGSRMVGKLNGDETRVMSMVRDEFRNGNFAIKDPKKPNTTITMKVSRQKGPSIKVRFEGEKPVIDVKIFLEGDILAIQSTIDYENKELKPLVEKELSDLVKNQLDKTFQKCQGLNCDVFKLGSSVAMHFRTIPEFEEYNWLKRFKDAQINTQISFKIRRTGTMIKSSEFFSTKGKKGE